MIKTVICFLLIFSPWDLQLPLYIIVILFFGSNKFDINGQYIKFQGTKVTVALK